LIHSSEDLRALPAGIRENLVQNGLSLLGIEWLRAGQPLAGEKKEKHCPVAARGKAPYLAAGRRVADGNQLVAWPIASDLEGGDVVSEVLLELTFGPEDELANGGMQSVGANDEVELARGAALEGDEHAGGAFVDGRNAVVKEGLDAVSIVR
jgi:hypothetical protein